MTTSLAPAALIFTTSEDTNAHPDYRDSYVGVSYEADGRTELIRDYDGRVIRLERDEAEALVEELNVGPLVAEAHICAERRSYMVTFEGTDEEIDERASAWMAARSTTHAMHVDYIRTNLSRFPKVDAYLNPECSHGLSLSNCYGPGHYMPDNW